MNDLPTFLTAEWRHLVMINYAIDGEVLEPYVPANTELDVWNGTTYVSLVAFRFLNTKVKGLAIPFHRNFEEINLRFYVRAPGPEGWRRGVVFVREVVPRAAIASIARWFYNEKYVACPTGSVINEQREDGPGGASYSWKHRGKWLGIGAEYEGRPLLPAVDSEEEFISEHYWGYSRQRDGSTVEYRVMHPQWRVWSATGHTAEGDFAGFYGPEFAAALAQPPTSVFVAEGSAVSVHKGDLLQGAG